MKKILSLAVSLALLLSMVPMVLPSLAHPGQAQPIYVSDMTWLSSSTGMEVTQWAADYPIRLDRNLGDDPIVLGGVSYTKGIGTAPFNDNNTPADIVFAVPYSYTVFEAVVGVDDCILDMPYGNGGTVVFEVLMDGVKVAETPVLKVGVDAYPLSVDITGASELTLRVWNGGDGYDYDWAVWADAKILSVHPSRLFYGAGIIRDYGSFLPWSLNANTLYLHGGMASYINWEESWQSPWNRHGIPNISHFTHIEFTGPVTGGESLTGLFFGTTVHLMDGLEYLDSSSTTDMSFMFMNADIPYIDLSVLDTGSVVNMTHMFFNAKRDNPDGLDLSAWDVGNVQNTSYMFSTIDTPSLHLAWEDTGSLEIATGMFGRSSMGWFGIVQRITGLTSWDTSSLKDMSWMFSNLRRITSLDLSGWDLSSMENMSNLFGHQMIGSADNLVSLNLSGWDTRHLNDTIMSQMMFGLRSLRVLTLGEHFVFHGTAAGLPEPRINSIYTGLWVSVGNGTIDAPEAPNVIPWWPATGLSWTSRATSWGLMAGSMGVQYAGGKTWVWECTSPRVSSGVITAYGSHLPWSMHADGTLLLQGGIKNTINWETWGNPWYPHTGSGTEITKIVFTDMVMAGESATYLFFGLRNLTAIENLSWLNTHNTTDMSWMFAGANMTNVDVSGLYTGNVTDMSYMFSDAISSVGLDLSAWNVGNVRDISGMFNRANIPSLNLSWVNTGSLERAEVVFGAGQGWFAPAITSITGLSGWNTSNMKNMRSMFLGLTDITSLDLSGWDLSSVEDMSFMFGNPRLGGAYSLQSLNLSGWDTRHLSAGSMSSFISCSPLLNELTLGTNFVFHSVPGSMGNPFGINAGLINPPQNATYTGFWRNVGSGTVSYPKGSYIVTASELMDGVVPAGGNTWAWQRVPPTWVQPLGGHDAYALGDEVMFNGELWVSRLNGNSWAPGVAGWDRV
jgi:surface protein